MLVFYFIAFIFTKERSTQKSKKVSPGNRQFVLLALVSGLLSCVYNRLNIYLAGNIDAVIFFPSFNGGVIILSALLSVLLLREKLNIKQIFGLLSGAAGICIIGIL
jgi:drug/metabolite transporter (DMT)-like permease